MEENKVTHVRMLTDEEYAVLQKLDEARGAKKEWEEEEARCRAALLDAVEGADTLMYDGNIVSTIEKRTSRRWNRKLFAKDWAALDAMEEYNTVTESTVVNIVKSGDEGE